MGCVPHRANGVRPERPAWVGVFIVSEVVGVVGVCGIVSGDSYRSVLEMVMPKGNQTGVGAKKKQAARKAVMKRGVPKGSANKRSVKNASSSTSQTRMFAAKRKKSGDNKSPRTYYGGRG